MKWALLGLTVILIAMIAIAIRMKNGKKRGLIAKAPLSAPEQVMYHRLVAALPNHVVLAQVSFSRFLKATGGTKKENWASFASIKQKVADYLICRRDFSIAAVIELDDASHNVKRDGDRDSMLGSAGLKTLRWNVKNLPTKEQIIEELSKTGIQ